MYRHAAWLPVALWCGLAGCSGRNSNASDAARDPPTDAQAGSRIYSGSCVACHQQDARGIPGVYPSLVGSPVLLGDPAELTLWVIKGLRPASMPAGRYPTKMPQFGWMKEQDASALFSFLRTHFGNTGRPVDASTVTQALGPGA